MTLSRTKTVVDPASLRFAYTEADEPVTETFTAGMSGEQYTRIYRGNLTVSWDTPDGKTFNLLRAVEGEPHPDTLEELRAMYADDVARAYDQHTGA